jgi:hypothetical protein
LIAMATGISTMTRVLNCRRIQSTRVLQGAALARDGACGRQYRPLGGRCASDPGPAPRPFASARARYPGRPPFPRLGFPPTGPARASGSSPHFLAIAAVGGTIREPDGSDAVVSPR